MTKLKAIFCAFLAALFYSVNIPLSKLLLKSIEPTTMAALLYLGAGIGVGIMLLVKGGKRRSSAPLSRRDMPFVIGMIVLDIAAPILLMFGIRYVRTLHIIPQSFHLRTRKRKVFQFTCRTCRSRHPA